MRLKRFREMTITAGVLLFCLAMMFTTEAQATATYIGWARSRLTLLEVKQIVTNQNNEETETTLAEIPGDLSIGGATALYGTPEKGSSGNAYSYYSYELTPLTSSLEDLIEIGLGEGISQTAIAWGIAKNSSDSNSFSRIFTDGLISIDNLTSEKFNLYFRFAYSWNVYATAKYPPFDFATTDISIALDVFTANGTTTFVDINGFFATDETPEFPTGYLMLDFSVKVDKNSLVEITVQNDAHGRAYAQPIPEPASLLLLGSGLIGLTGIRRRFRKNRIAR